MDKDKRKIRILVAKPGTDSHYKGAELLCQILRNAGMEVIYTGRYQTSEMIVNAAIAEDVDVVALSSLAWSQKAYYTEVARMLKERGAGDICVVGGGIIAESDKPALLAAGVTGLYGPGTPYQEMIDHIVQRVKKDRWHEN
ncbi:MAG: cobalamin B12-binding domain-containing protein [Dehalococcoidia bacterium]|nr:cobalamin B12-binding domain-containing protein [Dehalococcoidia bacterium]